MPKPTVSTLYPDRLRRQENRLVDDFVRQHEVFGTAGIHPHVADAATDDDVAEIRRIVTTNPRIVAVGETGRAMTACILKRKPDLLF